MVSLFSWHVPVGSILMLTAMNAGMLLSQPLQLRSAPIHPLVASNANPSFLLAQSSIVETVDRVAAKITVRIESEQSGTGSGVIVAQQGTTYYVLTAEHVVPKPDNYSITAPDGQKYPVNAGMVKKLEGIDLAVVRFASPKAYQVATLANYYIGLEDRPLAFLSGFPGGGGASRQLAVGTVFPASTTIFAAQNAYSMASGRELVYTTFSQPGMSGGPVLDRQGRVIGIHNASETKLETDESSGEVFPTYLGRSLGVPIHTFLGLASQIQVSPNLLKVENTVPPAMNQSAIQAVLDFNRLEKPSDNSATAFDWLKYGNRLWRLGRFQEAVVALDRAIALKPNFHQAFFVKGMALSAQDRFSEAIAAFEAATRIEPRFYEAWRMQAQMLEQMKQYPQAIAAIDRAIQIQPDDSLLHALRGDLLFQSKQHAPATAAYTQAITLKPNYYTYMQRGRSQFSAGDYQAALRDYSKAIELQPNDYFSYIGRGTMNAALGKSPAALADLDRAITFIPAASPYQALLYMSRGLVKFGGGDFNGAIADWTAAINANIPGKTDLNTIAQSYMGRALAYARTKDLPKAIADMGQLIELQPKNAAAFYNRGEFYIQAGDPQRALLDLNQAIALKPDYADAIQTRGLARQSLKDFSGAIEDFKKAEGLLSATIDRDPNNINTATVYVRRANTRLGMGDKQGAIADIRTVVTLFQKANITEGPLYQSVQNMLRLLQQ
ncbi:tetratricopeptide repeat protein [Altericista sp. CCNU0014]|uniref:tetratricopeptide repeat protein n=1 Tax=Altericista sp. CCNU0014 TaxID=3082949 RepID=UPI003850CC4B